jgi:hypothetical protein
MSKSTAAKGEQMENELPEGLRPDIRAAVKPILEAARKAGWSSISTHWDSKGSRTVGFNAKSSSGKSIHGVWHESKFPERLKALLHSHRPSTTI